MLLPERRKPTAPGEVLLEDFLKPLNLTPKSFAALLGEGWTEKAVQNILDGKERLSEKAAKAFAEALGTTTTFWTRLQYHLSHYEDTHRRNEKGSLKPWKKAG